MSPAASAASLHHVRHGSGVPLVALHGFGVDHRMLLAALASLDADEVVERIHVDLPGHGRSPGTGIDSPADVVDAVDAWLDETVGDAPFLLLGASFGGLVARALLARRRERDSLRACPRGMALLAPVVDPRFARRDVPRHEPIVVDEAFLATLPEADRAEFACISVIQTPEQHARFREDIAPGARVADLRTLARLQSRYALEKPEQRPWAGPVTIVCGRRDATVGWRDQLALLDDYPRAVYAVLDAGHNVHLERPDAVQALLRDWLRACDVDLDVDVAGDPRDEPGGRRSS